MQLHVKAAAENDFPPLLKMEQPLPQTNFAWDSDLPTIEPPGTDALLLEVERTLLKQAV